MQQHRAYLAPADGVALSANIASGMLPPHLTVASNSNLHTEPCKQLVNVLELPQPYMPDMS